MIITYKKTILALLLLLSNMLYSQSKKEIIEKLNYKIDSLENAIDAERILHNKKFDELQNKNVDLQLKIKTQENRIIENIKTLEITKNKINNLVDSLNLLKSTKNTQTNFDVLSYYFSTFNKYDYYNEYHFNDIKLILEAKESRRLAISKYAIRNNQLKIKLLNNKEVILHSDAIAPLQQRHYVYITENSNRGKVYVLKLDLYFSSPGRQRYELLEINIQNGEMKTVSNAGNNFSFSPNMDYIIVSGWHDIDDYYQNSEIALINLFDLSVEMKIDNAEVTDIIWLSDDEFSFLINRLRVLDRKWEHGSPPKVNYDIPNFASYLKYKLIDGNWKLVLQVP
jgi:hypothetical protein